MCLLFVIMLICIRFYPTFRVTIRAYALLINRKLTFSMRENFHYSGRLSENMFVTGVEVLYILRVFVSMRRLTILLANDNSISCTFQIEGKLKFLHLGTNEIWLRNFITLIHI